MLIAIANKFSLFNSCHLKLLWFSMFIYNLIKIFKNKNRHYGGYFTLQKDTNQYHKFSIVVNELKSAETVPHKTAVMTFLNTLITCNPDLSQRCQIRNEMIGKYLKYWSFYFLFQMFIILKMQS